MFTISSVSVPQSGDSFLLSFRAVTQIWMVISLEMDAVAAVDGIRSRYRFVGYTVPAPGAAQHLAGEPQPDRATVSASGLLCVVGGAFALIHLPPLHQ